MRAQTDQPIRTPTMARVLVYSSLNSLEAVEGTSDQRRLRSDCAYAQADLSLRWSHKSYCGFCRELAQIIYTWLLKILKQIYGVKKLLEVTN